jgi:hypothetical protein
MIKLFLNKTNLNDKEAFDSRLMRRLMVFLVLFLFKGFAFGQSNENGSNVIVMPEQIAVTSPSNNATVESKMDLVFWLTGSKQSQLLNGMYSENTISTNSSEKKRYMNAGMSTKGVLYRTFLRKIINYKSTIA